MDVGDEQKRGDWRKMMENSREREEGRMMFRVSTTPSPL